MSDKIREAFDNEFPTVGKLDYFDKREMFEAGYKACASELRAELEAEKERNKVMRATFHVNMIRAFPKKSHQEISEAIDKAIKENQ